MLLMAAAFVNSAALRDFRFNTNQIVFSTPMRRRDYLLGRFVGATLVSAIPMLGVSAGILAAKYMPWADPDQWGAVNWAAHLHAIYVFALPNALIIAAILFAIAVMARNEVVPFIGALVLLIGYIAAGVLLQDLRHEEFVVFADPFGIRTFALTAKYWTVAEKNSVPIALSGWMLWNRLLWAAVGTAIFISVSAFLKRPVGPRRRRPTRRRHRSQRAAHFPALIFVPQHGCSWCNLSGFMFAECS
jgi:hypothetical protein